jgi:hypothetical protein
MLPSASLLLRGLLQVHQHWQDGGVAEVRAAAAAAAAAADYDGA